MIRQKLMSGISFASPISSLLLPLLLTLTLTSNSILSTVAVNEYKVHDKLLNWLIVPVYVNNVGPFHNPAESYPYYSLPYCVPKHVDNGPHSKGIPQHEDLGEVLAGDRRKPSIYDVRFNVDVPWVAVCHFRLTQNDIKSFMDAIKQHYIFEMFVDDLAVKGFIGEIEEKQTRYDHHIHNETQIYLFTHLDFSIAYNEHNVIAVNLTTNPQERVLLQFGEDIPVEFSFGVHWVPTTVQFVDRMQLHSKTAIGEQSIEIHWLSIINSFVLVILLTAFLGMILMRALHKDFARYMEIEDEELDEEEQADEVGWKLVHGDVFRTPKHIMLLSAAVGNGAQILVLIISLLSLSLIGTFYPGNRGGLYQACLFFYALTTFIAGYVATNLYLQLGGTRWATHSLLTSCLFAVPFFTTFSICNSVAWYYGSSSALPAKTIIIIIALWALVSFPLTIFGSMRAKNAHANGKNTFEAPCKTNRVEREIPPVVWYRSPALHMLIAGFLPFSAIYIELHYIFASVWGHRVYTLYGILSLAFIMLIIVTAFITVALTYFQLASEDYHWWWRSFFSGSSTGLFMYTYAIFYYYYRSEMSGVLQGVFVFGYMAMVSYAFALMLGTIAFFMARTFVTHIYRSIKID